MEAKERLASMRELVEGITADDITDMCLDYERLLDIAEAAYKLIEAFGNTGVALDGDTERHFVEIADPQLAIQLLLAVKALEEADDA